MRPDRVRAAARVWAVVILFAVVLGWMPPVRTTAMAELRRSIDPGEIANRGKMFPDGEAPALAAHGPHPLERAGIISRE